MKTKLKLLAIIISSLSFSTMYAQNGIVKDYKEVLNLYNQLKQKYSQATSTTIPAYSLQDLTQQTTIEVNSISKARLSDGHTRQVVQIHLPPGTKNWYYRITVLDISSDYTYQNNETLYYGLMNNQQLTPYTQSAQNNVDFFLLGSSGDVNSFLETGNNEFTSYLDYYKNSNTSFIGDGSAIIQDNLWIGIRNNNKFTGLKVIVEVVAGGNY